jgi:ATP adenylyltransferase/5',5'''-P-1,P-4-tetraphosphate phosphorylase II
MENQHVTEKEFAIKFLRMILSLRDSEKVMEEGTSEAYIDGYEEALQDLAEWLADEYEITEEELNEELN